MRRLMCWSLVLIVACVAVLPLTGCGSKKAPATIADLLAMPDVEDLDLPLPHHRELARAADLF